MRVYLAPGQRALAFLKVERLPLAQLMP